MSAVVGTQRRAGWRDEAAALGRRVGLPVLAGIAVLTVISACVGFIVTHALESVSAFDLHVTRTVVAHRTPALDRFTGLATLPADTIAVSVLSVVAIAIAAWRTRAATLPVFLLAAIGGEKLTYLLTTVIVRRPRPPVPPLGHVFATSSFPSGHVGSAIALYGAIVVAVLWRDAAVHGRRRRPRSRHVALGAAVAVVAVLVGFSRLYRGHHFLTDLLWGAVVGSAWLAIAWALVLRSLSRRQTAVAESSEASVVGAHDRRRDDRRWAERS